MILWFCISAGCSRTVCGEDAEVSCRHKDHADLLYGCREWLYVYERVSWGQLSLEGKYFSQVCGEDFVPVSPSVVPILPSTRATSTPPIHPCHDAFLSINELEVKKKKVDMLFCAFNSALKFRVHPAAAQPWAVLLKSLPPVVRNQCPQTILVCAVGVKTVIYVTGQPLLA